MIKKIKIVLTSALMAGLFAVPAVVPATVSAQANIRGGLACGAELNLTEPTNPDCTTDVAGAGTDVQSVVTDIINVLSVIVGIVAVIMIIIGGFKYVVSGGDSGNVGSAKNTIIYAIIGLVIVAFAQIVVRFVLSRLQGTTP